MIYKKLSDKLGVKRSAYATIICACAVILAAALILSLVSLIPSYISKLDMTSNNMYTLSDTSREILETLDENVTIYQLSYAGEENETIRVFLERYAGETDKIEVVSLDIEEDAGIIGSYTSSSPESNSLIIVSEDRYRFIPYNRLFSYSTDAYYAAFTFYSYYYQNGVITSSFTDFLKYYAPYYGLYDGYAYEMQVTLALRYVSASELPSLYMMLGHSETGISEDLASRIADSGIELLPLRADTEDIPDDADCILLMPVTDITENEYNKLKEYIEGGGRLMLITTYSADAEFENLLRLTAEMGLSSDLNAYLCEDNENYCYSGYPELIIPDISDVPLADLLEKQESRVLLGGSTGITVSESLPDGVTVTPILTSSPDAYTKTDTENGLEFNEETDTRSTYLTGVAATTENGGGLVWFSSGAVIYDDYDIYSNFGNKLTFMLFLNTLTENKAAPEIAPVMSVDTFIDAGEPFIYTFLALFCLLIPAGLVVFAVIRYKKR